MFCNISQLFLLSTTQGLHLRRLHQNQPPPLTSVTMNSIYNTVDYINNLFVYPSLNKIHGYPNYVSLLKLKKQLKTKAKSVSTDLGDGAHGHLGLVLSPDEYETVSRTLYEFLNETFQFIRFLTVKKIISLVENKFISKK